MKIDRYDLSIIDALRKNGRLSWIALAEQVNLSASSAQRRVQSLLENGVIRHFTLAVNNSALQKEVKAFVQVKINRNDPAAAQQFIESILEYVEVESCHKISGDMDFILNITAADLKQFSVFLENKILYLPGVMDARSSIVLQDIKENSLAIEK